MTDVSPAVEAPPPDEPSNPFSRIIGVLLSPIRTFESIVRKPDWVVPAILIIVVFLVAAIVTVPRVDFETMSRQAMEAQGRSGPQVEQALRFTVAIGKGIQYTVPFLLIGILAVAALLYWFGVRLVGGEATYQQIFSVVLYGFIPNVIRQLVKIPIVLSKHDINPREAETLVRSGPAFLTSFKAHPLLFAFFTRLDLFAIWSLILIVIGLAAASKLSKAKTAGIVITLWIVGTLITLGFAAIGAARGQ
jgi:hypothetical protein